MKILTRGLIGVGFILMMLGGAAMDNPTLIPMLMAFGGLGICYVGYVIEQEYVI